MHLKSVSQEDILPSLVCRVDVEVVRLRPSVVVDVAASAMGEKVNAVRRYMFETRRRTVRLV